MSIDFFTPIVKQERLHKNFSSVLTANRKEERELFNEWSKGFVDRDGKLVKEFQTSFNSTFWEVYLHAAFKEYNFQIDWSHATPDFCIRSHNTDFIVEAVTASAAKGKLNEWDKDSLPHLHPPKRFTELNKEAMIRLSNSIIKKAKAYDEKYKKLDHVKDKPFVIAIAPFEQPHFNHQYDRPIRSLLYDYYVDEDAYLENPELYPDGPPAKQLGFIEKDNGAEIELGIFNNPEFDEVSAILFSCVGTWGKLSAMTKNYSPLKIIHSTWGTPPKGEPVAFHCPPDSKPESILDGLQIFHNPYAKFPLSPEVFRHSGVVQHYYDELKDCWFYEETTNCLHFRFSENYILDDRKIQAP